MHDQSIRSIDGKLTGEEETLLWLSKADLKAK